MSPEDCEKAIAPLRAILAHAEPAVAAGSGTAEQIAERFAAMLEPGLIEHVEPSDPDRGHDVRGGAGARSSCSRPR